MSPAAASVVVLATGRSFGSRARGASSYVCGDPHSSTRDPSNPLALPTPPGPNPLNGANFFVDGPAHGAAAARSRACWASTQRASPTPTRGREFQHRGPRLGLRPQRPSNDPGLAYKVRMLEKIADEPEPQRFSAYAQGGSPEGQYSQAIKIFCHNMTADPGTIPIITTYFLHPARRRMPDPGAATRRRAVSSGLGSTRSLAPRRTGPRCTCSSSTGSAPRGCVRKMGSLRNLGGRSPLRGQQDRLAPAHGRLPRGRLLGLPTVLATRRAS